jgi:hypothetical protein
MFEPGHASPFALLATGLHSFAELRRKCEDEYNKAIKDLEKYTWR